MIVYFDETYDNARDFLLYGALFVPPSSTLHQRLLQVRRELSFRPEIKYTRCRNARSLRACKRVVDVLMEDTAYFRCVVVDQYGFDYTRFARPHESLAIAQARAY